MQEKPVGNKIRNQVYDMQILKKEEPSEDPAPRPQEATESPSQDLAQSSENQEVQIVVTDETVSDPQPALETSSAHEQLNMVRVCSKTVAITSYTLV